MLNNNLKALIINDFKLLFISINSSFDIFTKCQKSKKLMYVHIMLGKVVPKNEK